jgi:hypothetical protein
MFAQLTGRHSRRVAALGLTSYGPASHGPWAQKLAFPVLLHAGL